LKDELAINSNFVAESIMNVLLPNTNSELNEINKFDSNQLKNQSNSSNNLLKEEKNLSKMKLDVLYENDLNNENNKKYDYNKNCEIIENFENSEKNNQIQESLNLLYKVQEKYVGKINNSKKESEKGSLKDNDTESVNGILKLKYQNSLEPSVIVLKNQMNTSNYSKNNMPKKTSFIEHVNEDLIYKSQSENPSFLRKRTTNMTKFQRKASKINEQVLKQLENQSLIEDYLENE